MSDALHVYALLQRACTMLDNSRDHSIAAYVGLAMALMEDKYGVGPALTATEIPVDKARSAN